MPRGLPRTSAARVVALLVALAPLVAAVGGATASVGACAALADALRDPGVWRITVSASFRCAPADFPGLPIRLERNVTVTSDPAGPHKVRRAPGGAWGRGPGRRQRARNPYVQITPSAAAHCAPCGPMGSGHAHLPFKYLTNNRRLTSTRARSAASSLLGQVRCLDQQRQLAALNMNVQ